MRHGEVTQEKQAADDYEKQAIAFLELKGLARGKHKFSEETKGCMIDALERIRTMCTQMDSGQRKKGIDVSKEWDMANSMVVVGAMQLYLSGKLDKINLDERTNDGD